MLEYYSKQIQKFSTVVVSVQKCCELVFRSLFLVSILLHICIGFSRLALHVANMPYKTQKVSDPCLLLVPPDIFLATTIGLIALSAALLSGGTSGNSMKVNISASCLISRAASVA